MPTAIKPMSVAEFIELQIESSGLRQAEIAEACGFEKPNVITMIKQGKTKLPLAKIGPMARVLNVDPILLFKMVISEYLPETWDAIEALYGQPPLTENELAVLKAVRKVGLTSRKIGDSEIEPLARALEPVLPK